MAQAPVMPLFTDALVGDTTHLSAEEFGCYVLLLIATWRNNGRALPDDPKRMGNVCRVSTRKWRQKIRPILVEFFAVRDGAWHQKRLEAEWDRVNRIIQKRRAIGAAGGRANAIANGVANGVANGKLSITRVGKLRFPLKDSTRDDKPESDAAREGAKNQIGNPAPPCGRLSRAVARPCRNLGNFKTIGTDDTQKRPKNAALKAQIKAQLVWKHYRFLHARGSPGEAERYFAIVDETPGGIPPPEILNAVDHRMRAANWDDMRAWKHQNGIADD